MNFDDELINDTLDTLLVQMEEDFTMFCNIYKSLPLALYKKIEYLALSKSTKNKENCDKARKISKSFHKSFK